MSLFSPVPGPVHLVFPASIPGMAEMLPLLRAEKAEFEAAFGADVIFVDEDPGTGPRWLIEIDPAREDNRLVWERDARRLTSHARDAAGVMTTFNQVHSLVALGVDTVTDAPEPSMRAAIERIYREIAGTFPGFGIRGKEWDEITARHVRGDGADMTFEDAQRWIAELDDAHTAIRRPVPVYNPPYVVELTPERATIRRVPESSPAFHAGVRPGWTLEIADRAGWLARTGAPPHAKPFTAGRRAIALDGIDNREFTATSPAGERVSWTERAIVPALDGVFIARQLDARTAYLHPGNWFVGIGFEDAFDDVLTRYRHFDRLVLDLRGNTGGNLVLATQTRDRFLRERTRLGAIRFSRGDGTLADPVDLWGEPSADRVRWGGELVVLTDGLTYSASEDFLLGLQGLPHVTVIGRRSGGGSGRPRTIRLLDDMAITISTALTYDRTGTCIENHGVPVDITCDVFDDDMTALTARQA